MKFTDLTSGRRFFCWVRDTKPTFSNPLSIADYVFRAPSVSNERLAGNDELQLATETLARYKGLKSFAGVMAGEIGGSNGLRAFAVATAMDIPVVDADEIGRAFPRVDMCLPFIYKAADPCPAVLSDARGNIQVVVQTENSTKFENMVSDCY